MILLVARRGTVEDVLVVTLFTGAALAASRNVPVAALVVTPVLARGLAGLGTIDGTSAPWAPPSAWWRWPPSGWRCAPRAVRHPAYDLAPTR